ncbi:tRNA uridine-5-carboxymethylaminomethyl(34) synthesis GTPase MnmE [Pontibacter sp. SGAir0037]|uniref:tRNA uridine-5-carboxymethylaminomethyl(34) synthesis GTPase MnmE n=1 Tax=Pontibacter sp. SGAir0037 TaxID=2571030 RepID=UPI0010CCB787|nr:tRNA uridine-5-carboxymethylaminomethyl(34) synthesis GTPase MnmE [Pontibacter sp. SGAir0037]QCR21651.1 tRNA uridine-5-carboxymethylaminomethyl(34) synthesis GTPase MnmE [Pontibacter sp. SGAir0037]
MLHNLHSTDTIVAVATAPGVGAIAVIRLSGPEAISITDSVFRGKDLLQQASHTLHFGTIRDGEKVLDEVLVSLFVAPHSYTKENVVEISCHGSDFIVQQIIQLLLKKGARLANAGEFTKRAFLNGQFDLAQAEAVADLIASDSALSHEVAMKQMRGGFSQEIKRLRGELVHFASMIELELDFAEEDVEFADREQLRALINNIQRIIRDLLKSFELGNVIKNGVPTVIVGKPNAGKSTLLNKLLNEEKAIVSDVPGTTRDFIEDEINIEGITFRFIDTAGLRETTDKVEAIGVERTMQKLSQSSLIIYLFDITEVTAAEVQAELDRLNPKKLPLIAVANKIDQATPEKLQRFESIAGLVPISAAEGANLEELKQALIEKVNFGKLNTRNQTIVTNLRHVDSLHKTYAALDDVLNGLALGISNDLVAADIRRALYALGEITGEITTDDLLDNIFTKFCIGK